MISISLCILLAVIVWKLNSGLQKLEDRIEVLEKGNK